MNIGIIGTGYVGLVSSVCLAHLGHKVIAIDKREEIIARLSKGEATIYEEGLTALLAEGINNKRLSFSTKIQDLAECDVIFLAVGTPALPDGSGDLSQVYSAIESIIESIRPDTMLVVRSTIPVGTMTNIRKLLNTRKKHNNLGFCPEFLREGSAIPDFLHPFRIVLSSDTQEGNKKLQEVFSPLVKKTKAEQIMCETFETAELIKYAANVFLATKITFINQVAQLAQHANANIYTITKALGLDERISEFFLNPSPGYGGSCFPKDTMALERVGLDYNVDMSLVAAVHHANYTHKQFVASWILRTLNENNIHGKTETNPVRPQIAVWGLAFKANTDDVRESAAVTIISDIQEAGFDILAYDPEGNENFAHFMQSEHIHFADSPLDTLKNCSALVVLTEWKEFSEVDPKELLKVTNNVPIDIFDTRNILDASSYKKCGFTVHKLGIGVNAEN